MAANERKSWSVAELAAACGGRVVGDASRRIAGVAPLDEAGPEDLSFLADPRWERHLADTRAGAVILRKEPPGARFAAIVVDDPHLAYARAAGVVAEGLFPRATIGVAAGARVADSAVIGAGCSIYPGASVGERAMLGRKVTLHPGACVGDDCRIGDDVEVGPCCTIHRGAIGPTRIGRGSKLDALVLVAHNCQVGEDVRLVGQMGISGSSTVGDRAVLAGQVGVAGHLKIAPDVIVAAQSGVSGDVDKPGVYWGLPLMPLGKARRAYATMAELPEMRKQLRDLTARLERLEAGKTG